MRLVEGPPVVVLGKLVLLHDPEHKAAVDQYEDDQPYNHDAA